MICSHVEWGGPGNCCFTSVLADKISREDRKQKADTLVKDLRQSTSLYLSSRFWVGFPCSTNKHTLTFYRLTLFYVKHFHLSAYIVSNLSRVIHAFMSLIWWTKSNCTIVYGLLLPFFHSAFGMATGVLAEVWVAGDWVGVIFPTQNIENSLLLLFFFNMHIQSKLFYHTPVMGTHSSY